MKFLYQTTSEQTLRLFKAFVCAIWLFKIVFDPLPMISKLPNGMYEPTGLLLQFLPDSVNYLLIQSHSLLVLKVLLIVFLVVSIFFYNSRIALLGSTLLVTVHQSIIRGYGHVNHAELAIVYALYILTISAFLTKGKAKTKEEYAFPIWMTLLVLCLTYTFVAIHRMIHGGFALFHSDSILFWFIENSNRAFAESLHFERIVDQFPWTIKLLTIGFPIVTFVEIFAPLSLCSRLFRLIFVWTMLFTHIVNYIFMGFLFWENMLLFVFFFDVGALSGKQQSVS